MEWDEEGEKIVVRRVGLFTSEDIHRAIFATTPESHSLDDLKCGRGKYIKGRHARR